MIICRAFRGTGVGIDIEGIERQHIRFPNFETYVPPEKDEEHVEDPLTEGEIKLLADKERAYQQAQKQLRKAKNEAAKQQRAIARMNRL